MYPLLEMVPILIPVLLVDIVLAIAAILHILRHPHYRFGNRVMWLMIVVILLFFGPVIYFVLGKGKDE